MFGFTVFDENIRRFVGKFVLICNAKQWKLIRNTLRTKHKHPHKELPQLQALDVQQELHIVISKRYVNSN